VGSVESKFQLSIALNYIHAEKLVNMVGGQLQMQLQLALPSGQVIREGTRVILPFTLTVSTSPPVLTMTVKGVAEVRFSDETSLEKLMKDLEKGIVPQPIFTAVFQHCYFEVLLFSRELGLPPPIPTPQPQQVKQTTSTGVM